VVEVSAPSVEVGVLVGVATQVYSRYCIRISENTFLLGSSVNRGTSSPLAG